MKYIFFEKSYRIIEPTEDYTVKKLCVAMNKVYKTNLKSKESDFKIIVTKKHFSDGYPFNIGHLSSLMIRATTKVIEGEVEEVKFTFELDPFHQFSVFSSLIFLSPIALMIVVNQDVSLGLFFILFIVLNLFWTDFLYKMGMKNFLKNWDHFIGSKM